MKDYTVLFSAAGWAVLTWLTGNVPPQYVTPFVQKVLWILYLCSYRAENERHQGEKALNTGEEIAARDCLRGKSLREHAFKYNYHSNY